MNTNTSYRKLQKLYNTLNDTHMFLVKASEEIERIERIQKIYKKQKRSKKQSGGTNPDLVAKLIGIQLFNENPVYLYEFLDSLISKFHDQPKTICDKKEEDQTKLIQLKNEIKNLKKQLTTDIKTVCKSVFTLKPSQISICTTLKEYFEQRKQMQKQILDLKSKNYLLMLHDVFTYNNNKASQDINLILNSFLNQFNKITELGNVFYYLEVKNNIAFYTIYAYSETLKYDKIIPDIPIQTEVSFKVYRCFYLTGKTLDPIIVISHMEKQYKLEKLKNDKNYFINLQEQSREYNGLKPFLFQDFLSLDITTIKKHLYLCEYDALNTMSDENIIQFFSSEQIPPNYTLYEKIIIIEVVDDFITYLAHYNSNDMNVYLVDIVTLSSLQLSKQTDVREYLETYYIKTFFENIVNYFTKSREDQTSISFPKDRFYFDHIPSPERYKYYPKFNEYIENILQHNPAQLNGLWIILDDI